MNSRDISVITRENKGGATSKHLTPYSIRTYCAVSHSQLALKTEGCFSAEEEKHAEKHLGIAERQKFFQFCQIMKSFLQFRLLREELLHFGDINLTLQVTV